LREFGPRIDPDFYEQKVTKEAKKLQTSEFFAVNSRLKPLDGKPAQICAALGYFMPRVFIPSQLRDLTGGLAEVEAPGQSVRDVVAALELKFSGIRERLCRGDELAPNLQVSIDGVFSRRGLDAKVGPASEVHFLPVFGGG
jgi:molybdopterin converting factor small subunit